MKASICLNTDGLKLIEAVCPSLIPFIKPNFQTIAVETKVEAGAFASILAGVVINIKVEVAH